MHGWGWGWVVAGGGGLHSDTHVSDQASVVAPLRLELFLGGEKPARASYSLLSKRLVQLLLAC